MNTSSRDDDLCQDYKDGMEINELARAYGLSERRVSQILRSNGIDRRPRRSGGKKALSSMHVRLGLHLYHYRHQNQIDLCVAADEIGWSSIALRKVENGTKEVELLDLIDIAAFTNTPVEKLLAN